MKKLIFFLTIAAVVGYIIYRQMKLKVFVRPFVRRKCDAYGCGNFGASRDSGKRTHGGMDVLTKSGQVVFAPMSGVVRLFKPYEGYEGLDGIEVSGKRMKVKLMYVEPAVENGVSVKEGQVIGWAQSLQAKYPGISDHIHVEVYAAGVRVNPSPYFPADTILKLPQV